jgi:hypothetical protein
MSTIIYSPNNLLHKLGSCENFFVYYLFHFIYTFIKYLCKSEMQAEHCSEL